jgi:hypothetical protein
MIRRKTSKYPTRQQLAERKAWAEQFDRCWVCRRDTTVSFDGKYWGWDALQTHEMARRSQTSGKWADVRNYFVTCGRCHVEILAWLELRFQLALKALNDPDNYDRQFINKIRGEAPNSVEEYEVSLAKRFWKVLHER